VEGNKIQVSLKLSSRQVGEITVVDVGGRFTMGESASTFRDAIGDLVAAGHKKLLLNLAEVSYIDSSGIGELVAAFTTLSTQGGVMKVINLTKRVKDLLQITRQHTLFEVHQDEATALASFR
jgi:anti-sigma B factor antagonist